LIAPYKPADTEHDLTRVGDRRKQSFMVGKPRISPLTLCFLFGVVAAISSIVLGKLGMPLAGVAMCVYAGFAFQPTTKRALIVSAFGVIWSFGVYFFFDVRPDATGFAVLLVCFAICLPIARRYRRQLETPR